MIMKNKTMPNPTLNKEACKPWAEAMERLFNELNEEEKYPEAFTNEEDEETGNDYETKSKGF